MQINTELLYDEKVDSFMCVKKILIENTLGLLKQESFELEIAL